MAIRMLVSALIASFVTICMQAAYRSRHDIDDQLFFLWLALGGFVLELVVWGVIG